MVGTQSKYQTRRKCAPAAVVVLLGSAMYSACESPDQADGREAAELAEQTRPATRPEPARLVGVSVSGSLCPRAQVATSLNGGEWTSVLGTQLTSEGKPVDASCSVTLDIELDSGVQLGLPSISYSGYGFGTGIGVESKAVYSFVGAEGTVSRNIVSSSLAQLDAAPSFGSWNLVHKGLEIWSPCGGARRVQLKIDVTAVLKPETSGAEHQGTFALSMIGTDFFSPYIGATFRACTSAR